MTNPADLSWVVSVAGIACAYMSWGIGANDVANSFGVAFGARCLSIRQATAIAAVCELAGAILMGGHVSETIRKGMMDVDLYGGDDGRTLIMIGMTSVLFAAATWLLLASKYGLPVSTTHSAVGGVVAFAIVSQGYGAVNWSKVGMIIASWFISPAMSAIIACVSYLAIIHLVLKHQDSFRRMKLISPFIVFIMVFVVAMFTIYKGGKGLGLNKTSVGVSCGISAGIAIVCALVAIPLVPWYADRIIRNAQLAKKLDGSSEKMKSEKDEADKAEGNTQGTIASTPEADTSASDNAKTASIEVVVEDPCVVLKEDNLKGEAEPKVLEETEMDPISALWLKNGATCVNTERLFVAPVAIVAALQSLAHGANDCANAVGPFSAVLAAMDGPLSKKTEIPIWVFIMSGVFIAIGLLTFGKRVMATIGEKITPMKPSKAFCSLWAVFLVCLIATRAGIPISTTHAAVGSVVGVGWAEGIRKVDWKLLSGVAFSWIVTLPIVGLTASGIFGMFLPTVWARISLVEG